MMINLAENAVFLLIVATCSAAETAFDHPIFFFALFTATIVACFGLGTRQ